MDDVMIKQAELEAFADELEKIADARGLSEVELGLLKEALGLTDMRAGLNRGVQAVGQGLAQRGLPSVGKTVGALAQPIETGAAGHALQAAGKSFQQNASPGVLGGMAHGVGEALQHEGHALAGGGARAIGRAAWKTLNPLGSAAEVGLTGAGHMAARATGATPGGLAHNVLTKVIPKAGEIGAGAGMGALAGAPMGMAGLLGHHAMGALGGAAPALAEVAHHGIGALGEAGGELAHHIGADVLGTHGHGVLSGIAGGVRKAVGGAARGLQQMTPTGRFLAAGA